VIDAPSPALKFQATSVRFRILGLLTVLSFVNYLLRNNLSVAQPSIQNEFHFTNTEFGWILFGFNIAYTAFQIPGGLLGVWLGPRRSLTIIAIAWGVLTVLTGLAPGLALSSASGALWALAIVRFLMGVANAPMFPIVAATFANWFPVANWAFPNAVTNAGITFAQAALGPVVTTLIVYFGWRASFYILAPVGFAVGAWWWWYSRDTPREHRSVTPAELRLIEAGRKPPDSSAASVGATLKVMVERDVLLLAASYFCMNVVFYMFAQWLFAYLVEERGFAVLTSGWLYALPFATGAVMAIVGGAVCDTLCRRVGPRWGCRLPGAFGMVMVAVLLLAGVRAANPYVAVALLSLCFAFTQFADSSYWQATTFVAGPRTAAACGVLNTGGNLPGLLAPLVGYVIDHFGWMPAFVSGTVFALIGAALWLFVRVVPHSDGQPHGVPA
jgi:ACS family glucarate transporter-like MFS transporter